MKGYYFLVKLNARGHINVYAEFLPALIIPNEHRIASLPKLFFAGN